MLNQKLKQDIFLFFKKKSSSIFLIFCTLCCLFLLFLKIRLSISYHPDISGSERSTIFGIQQACSNLVIYQDPESYPFWIHNYSSAYFYLCKFFNFFLKWDSTDAYRMYILSRFVSFILVFGSLSIFYLFCTKKLKSKPIVSLIFTLFLFSILQFWRLTNSRVDSLLFFFSISFIYSVAKFIKSSPSLSLSNRWFFFTLILASFAPFVKQSGLILIIAFGAFLLWSGKYKLLAYTTVIWAILFSVFFFIFSFPNPSYFAKNLLANFASPLSPNWFYYNTFVNLFSFTTFIIAISFYISTKWIFSETSNLKVFLSISTFIFFGFATGTTFKHGSGIGYFHEYILVALLSTLYFFDERFLEKSKSLYFSVLCAISLSVFYITTNEFMLQKSFQFETFENDYSEQRMVKNYMEKILKPGEGLFIFCGENQRGGMLQHMLFKNVIAIQEDLINFTSEKHKLNFNKLSNYLRTNKVKYLIIDGNQKAYFYGIDFTFNLENYKLETTIGNFKIYTSKI